MKVLFDTSAFVKRYIEEAGTDQVIDLCHQASELMLSTLCVTEFMSTITRLEREKKITRKQLRQLKQEFFNDIQDATMCECNRDVIIKSIALLEKYPLRSLDALHVASAELLEPDLFVSADKRQADAAMCQGLTVVGI